MKTQRMMMVQYLINKLEDFGATFVPAEEPEQYDDEITFSRRKKFNIQLSTDALMLHEWLDDETMMLHGTWGYPIDRSDIDAIRKHLENQL